MSTLQGSIGSRFKNSSKGQPFGRTGNKMLADLLLLFRYHNRYSDSVTFFFTYSPANCYATLSAGQGVRNVIAVASCNLPGGVSFFSLRSSNSTSMQMRICSLSLPLSALFVMVKKNDLLRESVVRRRKSVALFLLRTYSIAISSYIGNLSRAI